MTQAKNTVGNGERYTWVQCFFRPTAEQVAAGADAYRSHVRHLVVIMTNESLGKHCDKATAAAAAKALFPNDGELPDLAHDVHLYPSNYVRDARELFAKGQFVRVYGNVNGQPVLGIGA